MGKRETKSTLNASNQQAQTANTNYGNERTESTARLGSIDTATPKTGLSEGYKALGGSSTPIGNISYEDVKYNPIANAGNIDTGLLKNVNTDWTAFGKDGGIDTTSLERMRGGGGFEKLATGNITNDSRSRMRGLGGYEEFAKDGGYNEAARADIRSSALRPISALGSGLTQELDRRRAVQGGFSPGFDASSRALMRDTGRGMSEASVNARLAVQDRVNAGRQWGIGGLSNSELGINQLESGNILAGSTGLAQSENAAQGLRTGNMIRGMAGAESSAGTIGNFDSRNIDNQNNVNMFNAGNELSSGQFNANNRLGTARSNVDIASGNRDNAQGMAMAGLGGLQGLYNTDVNREQAEIDRGLGITDSRTNADLGYLQNRTGLATRPGIGGNIMQLAGAGAGAAAGYWGTR